MMMMKTIFLFVCHVSMDPQNADRDREYGNRKTTFSARQVREVISKDKIFKNKYRASDSVT